MLFAFRTPPGQVRSLRVATKGKAILDFGDGRGIFIPCGVLGGEGLVWRPRVGVGVREISQLDDEAGC